MSESPARGAAARLRVAALAAALVAVAGGCVTTAPPRPERAATAETAFLVSPLAGYPLSLSPDEEESVRLAHQALLDRRLAEARAAATELLQRDPGVHPAIVLLAQADHLERRHAAAVDRLQPVLEELPEYTAARLLLARAAESLGDLPLAYASYRVLADQLATARERLRELAPRTVEIVANRLDDALERGRLDDAAAELAQLEEWAPDDLRTLQAARRVAAAEGDGPAELEAVRALLERSPEDRELLLRRADLELAAGDAGTGLRLLQDLAAADPDDRELAQRLARARFRWRVELLPPGPRELLQRPELSRGEYAAVLYWLFPSVRYSRAGGGTIANDVFDHSAREEIVRVVNHGLMTVDPTLHRFEPERRVTRLEALDSQLRLLEAGEPTLACLRLSPDGAARRSVAGICRLAARCGLIEEEAACLPAAGVSGAAAAEISRKTLERLGIE